MSNSAIKTNSETAKSKSSRIMTFDLMRGYFLIVIILNHLGWYPSGFEFLTYRGNLFVSTAEGFFLLSGLVLGIVRGQKLTKQPFKVASKKLLKRAVQLYVTSIVLMLLFTVIGWLFFMDNPGLKPGIRPIDQPLHEVLFGTLTFKYIYGWADFLRLYSIYIFISPLALWLLRKGLWCVVLLVSGGVWLFIDINKMPGANELLMVIPWQFIFFSGFVMGYHWNSITKWWKTLPSRIRFYTVTTLNTVAGLSIIFNIILRIFSKHNVVLADINSFLWPYFNKLALPFPRVLLFALWFWFGYWIFRKYEKTIMKYFGWILVPFGQNSLYVYVIHAFLVFFAHLIMPKPSSLWVMNLAGSLLILGFTYIAVKTRFLMKIIPR